MLSSLYPHVSDDAHTVHVSHQTKAFCFLVCVFRYTTYVVGLFGRTNPFPCTRISIIIRQLAQDRHRTWPGTKEGVVVAFSFPRLNRSGVACGRASKAFRQSRQGSQCSHWMDGSPALSKLGDRIWVILIISVWSWDLV